MEVGVLRFSIDVIDEGTASFQKALSSPFLMVHNAINSWNEEASIVVMTTTVGGNISSATRLAIMLTIPLAMRLQCNRQYRWR